jgi:hypothetical protein
MTILFGLGHSRLRLRIQVRLGHWRCAVRRNFRLRRLAVLDCPTALLLRTAVGLGMVVVAIRRIVGGIVAVIIPAVIRVVGIRRPRSIPKRVVPPRIPAEPPIAAPVWPSEPEAPTSPSPTAAPSVAAPTASPTIATPTEARRGHRGSAGETG